MLDYNGIDQLEMDVLKEMGNIGSGNAATALSTLLSERIDMKVPEVAFLEFNEITEIMGGAENVVVAILVFLENDIQGSMMFILKKDAASCLIDKIFKKKRNIDDAFDDMEISALNEIGNIISSAYLSSISELTGLTIGISVPYLSIDMAGALLSVPAIEFGKLGDRALFINSQICDDELEIEGHFILIPTLESYDSIMKSLGI